MRDLLGRGEKKVLKLDAGKGCTPLYLYLKNKTNKKTLTYTNK
jgi:hypothetical protein